MRTLAYLLGALALDVAAANTPRRPMTEPDLPPIASTPETAGAWRRWAEAGRTPAARGARPELPTVVLPAPRVEAA